MRAAITLTLCTTLTVTTTAAYASGGVTAATDETLIATCIDDVKCQSRAIVDQRTSGPYVMPLSNGAISVSMMLDVPSQEGYRMAKASCEFLDLQDQVPTVSITLTDKSDA